MLGRSPPNASDVGVGASTGDTLHVLTNLPMERADAVRVAALYRQRWTIEAMFQQLEGLVQSEVETLGYPTAALFAFAVGALNVLSTLQSALRSKHGAELMEKVSAFHVAEQAPTPWRGLRVILVAAEWCNWHRVPLAELAAELLRLAELFPPDAARKAIRGPKKDPPKRTANAGERHVSTQRILAKRTSKKGRG